MQIEQSANLAIAQPLSIQAMTIPLWGLVIFMLWTIAVVVLLLSVRIRHLAVGGSPKDFAVIDDNSLMWRLFRVQANLVENLPGSASKNGGLDKVERHLLSSLIYGMSSL